MRLYRQEQLTTLSAKLMVTTLMLKWPDNSMTYSRWVNFLTINYLDLLKKEPKVSVIVSLCLIDKREPALETAKGK